MKSITIEEIRKKFPQYKDISDIELVKAVRNKYYSDMPEKEFVDTIKFDSDIKSSNQPKRGSRALPKGRTNAFVELQRRYGDDSTSWEGKQRGGTKMVNYDEEELLKRYYRDQLGYTPKGSKNPLVHAGKYYDDMLYGAKQLAGWTGMFDGPSEKENKEWLEKQMIYGAADQSLPAQMGGLALNVAPGFLASPAAGIAIGAGLKGAGAKAAGNYAQRAAHRVASDRTVTSPLIRGMLAGAGEGSVQPVNPNSATSDKWREKLDNMAMGSLIAGGGNWLASKALTSGMGEAYNRQLKKEYPNLPITPKITVDKAYGNPTLESFRKNRMKSTTGKDTPVSNRMQDVTDAAERSIRDNIELIEKQATGSGKPISIGQYGNEIVDKFLKEYDKSKGTMNKLYSNVNGLDKVQVVPKDYRQFFGKVNNILRKKFVTTDAEKVSDQYKQAGPLRSIIKSLENLTDESKGNFDLIPANRIYNIEKDLNLQTDRIFNSDSFKHLRSTAMEMKRALEDFTTNSQFVMRDPRTGKFVRATRDNNQAMKDYKTAKEYAAKHYDRFTGEPALEDLIKYVDDPEWKKGRKVNPGSDLMNQIFQGESVGMQKENSPRANTILKLRHAIGDAKFSGGRSLDDALRKEAFAAMRGRPEQMNLDEFVTNIDRHIAPGGRSAIYDPAGDVKLFDEKTFNQMKELADATRTQYTPVSSLQSEVYNYKSLPQGRFNLLNWAQDLAFQPFGSKVKSVIGGAAGDTPFVGGAKRSINDLQVSNGIARRVPGEYDSAFPIAQEYGSSQALFSDKAVEDKIEQQHARWLWEKFLDDKKVTDVPGLFGN